MLAPLDHWQKLGNYVRISPDREYKIQKTFLQGSTHYLAYKQTGGRISEWCTSPQDAWQVCADDLEARKA